MKINFFGEDVELPELNQKVLRTVLRSEVKNNGFKLGIINYIFCSDSFLLNLNTKFLNHDYYTDVITFDYTEDNNISGDIYISIDMVLYNSGVFGQEYSEELLRVISHGLLHLLKFNDKERDDIYVMRQKESELMLKIQLAKD
jgi:rRNA maturation RNase YbeY